MPVRGYLFVMTQPDAPLPLAALPAPDSVAPSLELIEALARDAVLALPENTRCPHGVSTVK